MHNSFASPTITRNLTLNNHRYLLSGLDLISLVEEFGAPLYVYDAATIKQQYERLTRAFSGLEHQIKYACKALTNITILRFLRSIGSGLDTVSINELRIGMRAGFDARDIVFTPNNVSFEEIQQAIELGAQLNLDNLPMLERLGQVYGSSVPVCIRINPHIMAGGNEKISTGHVNSKFGISITQLDEVVQVVQRYRLDVAGLHMHTGSEIVDTDIFLQGARILLDAGRQFPSLRFFDFGGGFKVPYSSGDTETNIEELGTRLTELCHEEMRHRGQPFYACFEPGKYLVSEAGLLLVKANVIKRTPATTFVGVDSGLNHLLRPMFYKAHHDITNLSNPYGVLQRYAVAGYICETDTFAWDRPLHEVRQGDILAFHNAGAYGIMMASNYNSRPRPAEVFLFDGKAYLIRRRETLDDILSTHIIPDICMETCTV
ncbi:MAG: diaminopimelate decarboxylase [Bacteroidota bacterium]|nr:diaminopimelate decarboxylase [Candidatus Kapabacteria bacterium]MDW8218938.1 diaminopimelate decarboxylase [Bacteroidota bacterium]